MELKNLFKVTVLIVSLFILSNSVILGQNRLDQPLYLDSSQSMEKRVEDLLGRMTLAEKVGQMNMPALFVSGMGKDIPEKLEGCRKFTEGKYVEGVGPAGGFFTIANHTLHKGTYQQADFFNELQKIAIEKTKLGIPLLQTEEGTHGLQCSGGTIFPEGPAIGSTWNMELVKNIYAIAAREARAVGIHQLFTIVVEPIRDPRLGRNEEAYSEDPYLCSRITASIVAGMQGDDISANDKVVAGLCHFPCQSEPVSGLERGAMEISERKLREVYLPPWIAGIKKGGALAVMATYPTIDGVPAHASKFLLTDLLRGELGFDGVVLSEGFGISTIVSERLASNQKEAGELALKAGLDIGDTFEEGYMKPLVENVEEGNVSMDLIDRAVRRILRQKLRLGLFENPYVDPDYAVEITHTEESQNVALEAAREGIVLLKNENNLLPLKKDIKRIAVIGPNADHELNQLGDYTSMVVLQDIVTVLDGIRDKVSSKTKVEYVKGCKVLLTDLNEIKKAAKAAKCADVAVVVVGENEWGARDNGKRVGTDGEGCDVASLDLTGLQEELLKAVYESGTPTVLVLINGRPLSIRWAAEHIPAIVEAWLPGEKGGHAVADILFGDYNPSGKLPVTFPRHVGQIPVYYNYMPSKWQRIKQRRGNAYADMPASPLWEFGFGLSYTKYEYNNLQITPNEIGQYGEVEVNVDVQNIGERIGDEIVQLYISDMKSSISVPAIELQGFEKVSLNPGEKKTVKFKLNYENLGLYNRFLEFVVEPGKFEVLIGSSCEDIRVKSSFSVKN